MASAFVPAGEDRTRVLEMSYVEEEWLASGVDDQGLPYTTQALIRRPRDPARFSGTVIVEPLQGAGIAPIYRYCSPYILRSGHGWACVASQKTALEEQVKGLNANRYGGLHIGTGVERVPVNQASTAILAQAGIMLRSFWGPFSGARNMVLVGHAQTGVVLTHYITSAHASHRREGGAPIYDGFMPAGAPAQAFGPCDVPIIQVLSEGDVFDAHDRLLDPDSPGRHYRRADSDRPEDRFRLFSDFMSWPGSPISGLVGLHTTIQHSAGRNSAARSSPAIR
jgi:hypothetical protein